MSDAQLNYRFARNDEIPAVARLVTHSFPGAATRPAAWWEERLRQPIYGGGSETLFVGERGGRIVAALQLHRLHQLVGGESLSVAGVGTVTISPTHRRRGLAALLMTHALQAARERGDVASALYPFRTSFYRRLGYGEAGTVLQYQFAPDSLPDAPERANVELIEDSPGRTQALELYHRWARTQNGQLVRSPALWTQLCTAPDHALVAFRGNDGALEGYALVSYRVDLPRTARYLEVEEIVWVTNAARRGLYAWLASLGDQWEQLLVRALPAQRMSDWLAEPLLPHGAAPLWRLWTPSATLLAGLMFRIVDLSAAWSLRPVATDATIVVRLDVRDAQLDTNQGEHTLVLEAGRARIEQGGNADVSLSLDMATLSRLFIASLSPTQALDAGLITCDRPDVLPALDTALALPEPWTFDRF